MITQKEKKIINLLKEYHKQPLHIFNLQNNTQQLIHNIHQITTEHDNTIETILYTILHKHPTTEAITALKDKETFHQWFKQMGGQPR